MKIPEGWPTEEMITAGINAQGTADHLLDKSAERSDMAGAFIAMLASAPTPPVPEIEPACYGARNFMTKEFAPVLSESRGTIQNWIGDRHQSQDSITYEGPISLYTR